VVQRMTESNIGSERRERKRPSAVAFDICRVRINSDCCGCGSFVLGLGRQEVKLLPLPHLLSYPATTEGGQPGPN
jgi:hypothetical protein